MSDKLHDEFENEEDRRRFLKVSAKLAAVAAAAGLATGTASAADNPRQIQAVINKAIQSKSIDSALKAEGAGLDKRTVDALSRLSPRDLETLSGIKGKLGEIKTEGGTGVIIY